MPDDIDEEDAAGLSIPGGDGEDPEPQGAPEPEAAAVPTEEENELEDSSASNDAGSESGDNTGQSPEKPKGEWIPKGRFNDTWGRMRKAEAEREEFRAENAALKRENESLKRQIEEARKPSIEQLKEPNLEDFKSYDEWQNALVDHRVQKRLADQARQREAKERQEADLKRQREQKELVAKFLQQAAQRAAKDQAYATAVQLHGDLPYNDALLDRVLRSKDAAAIDAHFYANLDEFERVNALPKEDAIEELALLKSKLSRKPADPSSGATQQRKHQSSAPPPIRQPVGATTTVREPGEEAFTIR